MPVSLCGESVKRFQQQTEGSGPVLCLKENFFLSGQSVSRNVFHIMWTLAREQDQLAFLRWLFKSPQSTLYFYRQFLDMVLRRIIKKTQITKI